MKTRDLLRKLLACAVLLVPLATLQAQAVRYSTDFPDDQGWTLEPGWGSTYPSWEVDATPGGVLGSPPYHSAPYSLNFNDGYCYGIGIGCMGITGGTADSPWIDVSAPAGTGMLTFWCAFDTENDTACGYDRRRVQVSDDGFQSLLIDQCYDLNCGPPGPWHQHTLPVQPSWGLIQVRFYFHTWDSLFNDGAGWFVDDLVISTECAPPTSYCTAKVNSQGCTPVIHATGHPTPTQPIAFRIRAAQVINNKPGLLLYGYASAATPFQGGFLCITPPIQRISVANSGGNPPPDDCSGKYLYDFNDRIRSGVDPGLTPGEDVYAQYWSRDPQAPFQSGLTGGLSFVICP